MTMFSFHSDMTFRIASSNVKNQDLLNTRAYSPTQCDIKRGSAAKVNLNIAANAVVALYYLIGLIKLLSTHRTVQ